MRVGVVAEGRTDMEVIERVVRHLVSGVREVIPVQPILSATDGFGPRGGGFRGVRAWCQSVRKDFGSFGELIRQFYDFFVIHVDMDVLREAEIQRACACPPVQDSALELQRVILEWLDEPHLPDRTILCLSADNMEAWVLLAYCPNTPLHRPPEMPLECVPKPDQIIADQAYNCPRRLLRIKDGRVKKRLVKYRDEFAPAIVGQWPRIESVCTQAADFARRLRAVSV